MLNIQNIKDVPKEERIITKLRHGNTGIVFVADANKYTIEHKYQIASGDIYEKMVISIKDVAGRIKRLKSEGFTDYRPVLR